MGNSGEKNITVVRIWNNFEELLKHKKAQNNAACQLEYTMLIVMSTRGKVKGNVEQGIPIVERQ